MAGWRDDDPGLPIKFGPCSNGEYDPQPLSPVMRETVRRAGEECERNAKRLGMSRREFLLSVCGAATTLLVLDACTREAVRHVSGSSGATPGGGYSIPPEATTEPDAAQGAIGGEEFVFDIQGHLLEYDLNPVLNGQDFWTRFPQRYCGEDDPRTCYSIDHFMELMFLRSDTSMLVLSALPIYPEGSPLSAKVMAETRKVAEGLCRDDRVLLHGQALPNVGPLRATLEAMEDLTRTYPIVAWKTFTHFPDVFQHDGNAWWLDDHERGVPQVGEAFIRKAVELGIPRICAHKGFSRSSRFGSPVDIGPAARRHPDVDFVVYHSGYEAGGPEGPYTVGTAEVGINRLVSSLRRAGIGPNENVYAELGSTWWSVFRAPDQAAHVLGKLLRYVGEDNVVWGTDCLFYGSPQDQIQALRSFHISDELQERYGYPRLTKELKAKILGLNGARLYGVDPITTRCEFTRRELAEIRKHLPGRDRTLGPATVAAAERVRDHHWENGMP
ncbi:MAG TPA: amidohydrolase family protein [Actinomycetota bacterium]|nr:amidohydrolase family protein [Actinomycetota bacterium]